MKRSIIVNIALVGTIMALPFEPVQASQVEETENIKLKQNIRANVEVVALAKHIKDEEMKEILEDVASAEATVKAQPTAKQKKVETVAQPDIATIPQGKFAAHLSAYTAAADETGSGNGITASGARVQAGHTIACPKTYSFGTKIHFEGYGTYVCQDRGGAIKGNRFDVYMVTKAEAFALGRRSVTAQIVQ